jgi:hypothetical protein
LKGSGSDSIQYFKQPGHSDTCVECPVGDTLHWHVVALPLVCVVAAALVAIWRKYKRSYGATVTASSAPLDVPLQTVGNMDVDAINVRTAVDENKKNWAAKCWDKL